MYAITIILILGGSFLLYNKNKIKADSDLGAFTSEKEFNLVLNNKDFRFSIKSYLKDDLIRNYMTKSGLFKVKQVELIGFEDDFSLCNKPTLKLKDLEIICLVGDVGVHSQAVSFIREDLSILKIKDDVDLNYLISDVPNYQIQDYNNDGYDDLIVEDRNYDKNPLIALIRRYYRGVSDGFVFDKEERVEVQ